MKSIYQLLAGCFFISFIYRALTRRAWIKPCKNLPYEFSLGGIVFIGCPEYE
ncbi:MULTISPECIES: hypothetical protein [Apibacter]|uniref:hypothetical protein n=1 Tax=Apibacter TaxID=1778601 RepID=UPI0013E2AD47|nr:MULTISPECIES: hypothetical protein [Apibacter]